MPAPGVALAPREPPAPATPPAPPSRSFAWLPPAPPPWRPRVAPISDACLDPVGAEPLIAHRPGCEFTPAAFFWRWPGNVIVTPSEPGLGSCHDDTLRFPAPAPGCAPAPRVSVSEDGAAWWDEHDEVEVPDGAAAVVQAGVVETPIELKDAAIRTIERVAGPRIALGLSVVGFDPAQLAPIADRIVVLSLTVWPDEDVPRPIALDHLPPMPALRTLRIRADARLTGLASLARHPLLEGLDLGADVDAREARALAALPHLRVLSIPGERPRLLRRLRGLRRAEVEATLPNVRALERLPHLRELELYGPVSDDALTRAAVIPSLRHLSFGTEGYTARGASRLRHAHQLRTIVVRARGEDEGRYARLEAISPIAVHPRARVLLDLDEYEACELGEPWHSVACPDAPPPEPPEPPPPDPVADEVGALLDDG